MEQELLDLMDQWVLEKYLKKCKNKLEKVKIIAYFERRKHGRSNIKSKKRK